MYNNKLNNIYNSNVINHMFPFLLKNFNSFYYNFKKLYSTSYWLFDIKITNVFLFPILFF